MTVWNRIRRAAPDATAEGTNDSIQSSVAPPLTLVVILEQTRILTNAATIRAGLVDAHELEKLGKEWRVASDDTDLTQNFAQPIMLRFRVSPGRETRRRNRS
jgi:hypothetical protein